MKQLNYSKGKNGETLARRYLQQKGFRHLFSNYTNDLGEIDLIMLDGSTLVFIEVKLKTDTLTGIPQEMVTPAKIHQVLKVAQGFLLAHPSLARQYPFHRLDAVCIILHPYSITHYQNLTS